MHGAATDADRDETITKVEYSDGFGRLIQSRAQAEELDHRDVGRTMDAVGHVQADSFGEKRSSTS